MMDKLATQLLSRSVADFLRFCKKNLQLKEFSGCEETIKCMDIFNAAFYILNSRFINCVGRKKPLYKDNLKIFQVLLNNLIPT